MKNIILVLFLLIFSSAIAQQKMPNITLSGLNEEKIDVNNLSNSNDVKVFAFWATWCVPCINELDAISDVYSDWQDETKVEIIAVSTDDSRTQKRVRPLVNGKGWEYRILIDENQDLKRALNIATLPHVVIVKNGEILHRQSGYVPGAEDELYEIIQELSN
jgi:peroxiredoxin